MAAWIILIAGVASYLVGFIIVTVAEVLRLRSSGLVDAKLAVKYPVVTNIVCLITTAVSSFVTVWALFVGIFVFVGYAEFKLQGSTENITRAIFIVYIVVFTVMALAAYFGIFLLIRLITTQQMVKSEAITRKYRIQQAAITTVMILIASIIMVVCGYLSLHVDGG